MFFVFIGSSNITTNEHENRKEMKENIERERKRK